MPKNISGQVWALLFSEQAFSDDANRSENTKKHLKVDHYKTYKLFIKNKFGNLSLPQQKIFLNL